MQQVRDWQSRQHVNFSHHNHEHRSFAPRSAREAFGSNFDSPTTDAHAMLVVVAWLAALLALAWLS